MKSERPVPARGNASYEQEVAPHIWLKQNEAEGQFVEIVMPLWDLTDVLLECQVHFPSYAIQVLKTLAKQDPTILAPKTRMTEEQKQGLMNTQILGTVLARQNVREQKALARMPELQQAFGLAMKGRLRVTAALGKNR